MATYTFATITPPASTYTIALDLNNQGQLVGYYLDSNNSYHGFLYSSGTYTTVDPLGSVTTVAEGINASGQVVGFFYDASSQLHGFIESANTYTVIDAPGGLMGDVDAINDLGQFVGYYIDNNSNNYFHGFLDNFGAYTTIDAPGSIRTVPNSINNSTQIVGSYLDSNNVNHGFVENSGTYTKIDPPNSVNTVALDINAAGAVVGEYSLDNNSWHAFLYSAGAYTTIDPPGSTTASALSINAVGQIIGDYADSSGRTHGFFYTSGTYTIIDPPGSIYTNPQSINDLGQIAGFYIDNMGVHAFLASVSDTTPPNSTISQALLNDTGVSHTDLITSDGGVTITGKASEQVGSVQIWNAVTNTLVGSATISGDAETWSFSGNLAESKYQLYAKLTDIAGNNGQTSSQPTIVIDKTAPIPVLLDAVFNSAINLTILSGTSEANGSVSVYDGTKLIGSTTAASDGSWSLQANVGGSTIHSYTEISTDLAGNTGLSGGVTLYTPAANKTLQGGAGNDVLIGGPNDILIGGSGVDTFVFNPNFGKETIKDFIVNQDAIAFAQSLFPNGVAQVLSQAHDSKAGAVIVVDANDTVTLVGVTVAQLQSHASDIHFF